MLKKSKIQSRTSTKQKWGNFLEKSGIHIFRDYVTFDEKAGTLRPEAYCNTNVKNIIEESIILFLSLPLHN